jgi:hypothetical protein
MNDEMERELTETVVAYFKTLSRHSSGITEETRKETSARIAGVAA